ncbi:hypothetical protein CEXT_589311, partial [Caerostris extrusa]
RAASFHASDMGTHSSEPLFLGSQILFLKEIQEGKLVNSCVISSTQALGIRRNPSEDLHYKPLTVRS